MQVIVFAFNKAYLSYLLAVRSETAFSLAKCCNEGKKAARVISGQTSCYKKPTVFSSPGKMCLTVYKFCCLKREKDQACVKGEMVSR